MKHFRIFSFQQPSRHSEGSVFMLCVFSVCLESGALEEVRWGPVVINSSNPCWLGATRPTNSVEKIIAPSACARRVLRRAARASPWPSLDLSPPSLSLPSSPTVQSHRPSPKSGPGADLIQYCNPCLSINTIHVRVEQRTLLLYRMASIRHNRREYRVVLLQWGERCLR